MTKAWACGKIILFGEHAVVYGRPAIALPVDKQTKVVVKEADALAYETDQDIADEDHEKIQNLLDFLFMELDVESDVHISIETELPLGGGLGSSASLVIALIRALSYHFMVDIEDMERIALEGEKFFHGNPSGIDTSIILSEEPLYFIQGDTEHFDVQPLSLVIVSSSTPSDTKESIEHVRSLYEEDKDRYEKIFDDIADITEKAKDALADGSLSTLGTYMIQNHMLLKDMGVSNPELDGMVQRALAAGAYGAKLSGAGMGGNIVVLADSANIDGVIDAFKGREIIVASIE